MHFCNSCDNKLLDSNFTETSVFQVPRWGRVICRPVGLDHNAGPSAIPYGSSQGWILNGNLQDFFYKSCNIPYCRSIYIWNQRVRNIRNTYVMKLCPVLNSNDWQRTTKSGTINHIILLHYEATPDQDTTNLSTQYCNTWFKFCLPAFCTGLVRTTIFVIFTSNKILF